MRTADVIVVGGGVVGCAVAYSLAERGAAVTLLERDDLAAHASGVSAGMLAPLAEASGAGPFFQLCLQGLQALERLIPRLEEETGVDTGYSRCGLLRLAMDPREESEIRERCRRLGSHGLRWLSREEIDPLQPGITPEARGALYSPREGQVSGLGLARAFAAAASRRGARVEAQCEVTGLERQGSRIVGVRTGSDTLPADTVVLAAGPWAQGCMRWAEIALPVVPVRGQILTLRPAGPPLERIVWGSEAYLVPRPDGSLLAGATEEWTGFDARVTVEGAGQLLAAAARLVPSLRDATLEAARAGLRPGTPDRLPVLGPAPGLEGLFLAAGHFRNGVLLSGITGELIAEWALSGRAPWPTNPFSAERFQGVAAKGVSGEGLTSS